MLTELHISDYPLRNWKEIPKNISCVYKITHSKSQLPYFGRSKDLRDRARKHSQEFVSGKHRNPKMLNIYNKYGDEFRIEILVIASPDYCEELEGRLLLSYDLVDILNCHQNSKGGSTNQVWTKEQRENHSRIGKGRVHTDASKERMSQASKSSDACKKHLEYLFSDEIREKALLSAASPESRAKAVATRRSNGHKPFGDATKNKIVEAKVRLFAALNWAVATNSTRGAALTEFKCSWDSLKKYQTEWEAENGPLILSKRAAKEMKVKKTLEQLKEALVKRAEDMKGEKNPMFGRTHTDEARLLISKAATQQAAARKLLKDQQGIT